MPDDLGRQPAPRLSPAQQLLYSATKLTTLRGGTIAGSGTGFFYGANRQAGESAPTIVTNKHVIEGCDQLAISMHLADKIDPSAPSGRFETWLLNVGPNAIPHPNDEVDLVCLPIGPALAQARRDDKNPFIIQLSGNNIPAPDKWGDFDAIEQVTMVGCPAGLFDEANNLPILRRGITASDPSKKFSGREEFLVDLACFPGSSGSPVFLYDLGGRYDRATGGIVMGGIRLFLLGVLYAGPTISSSGEIILTTRPKFEITSVMHLGAVIRSTQLLEFDRIIAAL